MGSNFNFKGFVNDQTPSEPPSGSGRPLGNNNFSLTRQPSVYSLTFDEFQSSLGKDFGSMNMDELLKSIWSAEETHNMGGSAATVGGVSVLGGGGGGGGQEFGNLQRQGSLTLPRTLSQKTVDEVWKNISNNYGTGKDAGISGPNVPQQSQRQPTLGEITLEEFLVRAGVVREDTQLPSKPNNNATGLLGDVARANNNNVGFGIDFQQPSHGIGLTVGIPDNNHQISLQSPNLPLNVNGIRSSPRQPMAAQLPQQPIQQPPQQRPQQQSPHQPTILPKQATVAYAPPMAIPTSTQLGSPGIRGGMMGLTNPTTNGGLTQGSTLHRGAIGIVGMGGGAMGISTGSPALSSDGLSKSNGDTPSPVPFMFSGGLRGRKGNNALEKVIERRQRRMIKNRESAARSRARKQAYTVELEEKVAKLKEENQELRKKQAEIMEMQKNQAMEMGDAQPGAKKRCLRRTNTGPW